MSSRLEHFNCPDLPQSSHSNPHQPLELDASLPRRAIYRLEHPLPVVPVFIPRRLDLEVTIHHDLQVIVLVVPPVCAERPGTIGDQFGARLLDLRLDGLEQFRDFRGIAVAHSQILLHLRSWGAAQVVHPLAAQLE